MSTSSCLINFQMLPKLEKEVFEWENKYKAMEAIKRSKEKVKALKNELAWSYVHAAEEVWFYFIILL